MRKLPCQPTSEEGPTWLARLQLARQVVWAWHLGVVVSAVELDVDDPANSFVDYGELWEDDSWQAAMRTASLCAADCPRGPGAGSVESETVQEVLAWAAALDGSVIELDPQRLEQAELELRTNIDQRLRRPELAVAIARIAEALTQSTALDACEITRLLAPTLQLGGGRASFARRPSESETC